jgi:hypothetical protein
MYFSLSLFQVFVNPSTYNEKRFVFNLLQQQKIIFWSLINKLLKSRRFY